MFEENNEVDNSAETTTHDDYESSDSENESTDESQVEKGEQSSESRKTETPEQRKARIKRMYEREFGIKDKGSSEEGTKESSKEDSDDRYARLDLKTEGITSKKAQDIVLEYAKFKGIDHSEALKSPIVRAEIAELEKKTSAPAPSKRTTGGPSDDFAYWVKEAKKGNFPLNNPDMMRQLQKARIFTS